MRLKTFFLAICALVLLASASWAATDTKTLNISATVDSRAKITWSNPNVTFPDADPDTVPSITDNNSPHNITCSARTGASSSVTLVVRAADDLKDGTKTIPISNVTWTHSGAGYVDGTMSKSADIPVGTWTGSGSRSGTLSYALANSWDYETGNYNATATLTLTAP